MLAAPAALGRVPAAMADASPAADDQVVRVVELTNVERQKAGLGPLAINPALNQAASGYAAVLASTSCFAHTCGPVPDFAARAANAGYTGWTGLAENIAGGQRTPEQVVSSWMNSPGHRANILNGAYNEIGVGIATGGPYGIYWAQEFGARRGVAAPAPAAAPAAMPAAMPAPASGSCGFVLGFATLRARVGAAAGECIENERFNPVNGNAEQQTTGGLFVWRKADNWTAFTDGFRTWVNGPFGVQQRLNSQRFSWEGDPV
jgi:hypothetical protein